MSMVWKVHVPVLTPSPKYPRCPWSLIDRTEAQWPTALLVECVWSIHIRSSQFFLRDHLLQGKIEHWKSYTTIASKEVIVGNKQGLRLGLSPSDIGKRLTEACRDHVGESSQRLRRPVHLTAYWNKRDETPSSHISVTIVYWFLDATLRQNEMRVKHKEVEICWQLSGYNVCLSDKGYWTMERKKERKKGTLSQYPNPFR